VNRYVVTIEGVGFTDTEAVELPWPPATGETFETKVGTCIVTSVETGGDDPPTPGRIVCRLP
jgi:hypothetical protein